MEILLFIVVFLLALDHSSITKILSRPMLVCAILGIVSGNVTECVLVGATLEIYYISCEVSDNNLVNTSGFLFASVVACMSVITLDYDSSSAISIGYGCLVVGMIIAYMIHIVSTLFLPMARNAVMKGKDRSLFTAMLFPYLLQGFVYGALTVVAYKNLDVLTETFVSLSESYWFIANGIATIALLMPCISFAILLRNIGVKDVPGAVAGGIAVSLLTGSLLQPAYSSMIIACSAILIGWLAYHVSNKEPKQTKEKVIEEVKEEQFNEGGADKWW